MPTAFETNVENFALELATQFNFVQGLLNGNALDLSALTTSAKGNLMLAINEVVGSLGGVSGRLSDLESEIGDVGDGFQPLDEDLSAIAALATTPFGRALLTQATSEGLTAVLAQGTTTTPGILELATLAESTAGSDTQRAVSPAGVKACLDALVAGAPGILDTLAEIATALGNDPNLAATLNASIAGKQTKSDSLTALAGLSLVANKLAYATGPNQWALADFSAFGRSVIACVDAQALRDLISVYSKAEIGTNLGANLVTVFRGGLA